MGGWTTGSFDFETFGEAVVGMVAVTEGGRLRTVVVVVLMIVVVLGKEDRRVSRGGFVENNKWRAWRW